MVGPYVCIYVKCRERLRPRNSNISDLEEEKKLKSINEKVYGNRI